jgi:hypothetical protein
MKRIIIVVLACLFLIGCAITPTTQGPQTVPAGCENALVYTKIPGFMPNGPMITRVSVSTALAVAATAGHPEIKLLVATIMPILFQATLKNTLAPAIADVQARFKTPEVVNYVTPFLVLFDSLNQAGVIKTGGVTLTDCDKNVLASLFKNIGLDSGTDPILFQ